MPTSSRSIAGWTWARRFTSTEAEEPCAKPCDRWPCPATTLPRRRGRGRAAGGGGGGAIWRWLLGLLALLVLALLPVGAAYQLGVRKPVATILDPQSPEAPDAAAPRGKDLRLILDEAFWKARLELSGRGAPYLALDLVDSLAVLEVRGVVVRRCRIKAIDKSALVARQLERREFRERLARPFGIIEELATLPKEPIRIEEAPKDTLEAQQLGPRKLIPEPPDLFYILRIDGGLTLDLRQLEPPAEAAKALEDSLRWQARRTEAWSAFTALAKRELPAHEPVITLTLARDDIKAIYRALVAEAGLAIRL